MNSTETSTLQAYVGALPDKRGNYTSGRDRISSIISLFMNPGQTCARSVWRLAFVTENLAKFLAFAQGTARTHQSQLNHHGSPAFGSKEAAFTVSGPYGRADAIAGSVTSAAANSSGWLQISLAPRVQIIFKS